MIPEDFLDSCVNLTSIDLSPLSNVTTIGVNFLDTCYNLTSVDLSGLSNVAAIGESFLYSCSNLSWVDMGTILPGCIDNNGSFLATGTATIFVDNANVGDYRSRFTGIDWDRFQPR